MSSIHTNNHNIETQLMNEFDCTDQLLSMYRNGRLDKSEMNKFILKCVPGNSTIDLPDSTCLLNMYRARY